MRIQAKHPYSRIVDAEVALQRSFHQTQFGEDFLFCNLGRHILQRNMPSDYSELDAVRNHQHGHILHTETALQKLGVARELESLPGHRFLVDRACDKHIYLALLDISDSCFKSLDSCLSSIRHSRPRLAEDIVREAIENVNLLCLRIPCAGNGIYRKILDFRYGLAVESEQFW